MEIFLIKKEQESFSIIEDYFFKLTSNGDNEKRILYFKKKNLIEEKHYENFDFNLPFSVLSKFLKTMESEPGEFFVHNISISAKIW